MGSTTFLKTMEKRLRKMADYISKEDAIKLIREDKVEITPLLTRIIQYYSAEQAFDAINQACERHIAFIRALPVEDVQPVVLCKDCKHRPTYDGDGYENGFDIIFPDDVCPLQCEDGWYNSMPTDNWFCANGERKDGENGETQ